MAERQGRTLWERMTQPAEAPPHALLENPAKLRLGGTMTIRTIDLGHLIFTVEELWQWVRTVNGRRHVMTDYHLLARPHDGEDVNVVVRLIPLDHPDPANGYTHHCCVLKRFFECGWDDTAEREGIQAAVSDPAGELVWHQGQADEARFWRIHTKDPYDCEVTVADDFTGDGRIAAHDLSQDFYQMWDFHRDTLDEAGQKTTEYLFVHHSTTDRRFEALRGEEIDLSRITE